MNRVMNRMSQKKDQDEIGFFRMSGFGHALSKDGVGFFSSNTYMSNYITGQDL
jgi:hypothetical protein